MSLSRVGYSAGLIAKAPWIVAIAPEHSLYSPLSTEETQPVEFCHQHNLVDPSIAGRDQRFGIRVTLPSGDSLRKVLGDDWERLHWFATESERDQAYEQMAIRHGYYRHTDNPTQILEKISR